MQKSHDAIHLFLTAPIAAAPLTMMLHIITPEHTLVSAPLTPWFSTPTFVALDQQSLIWPNFLNHYVAHPAAREALFAQLEWIQDKLEVTADTHPQKMMTWGRQLLSLTQSCVRLLTLYTPFLTV